MLGSIKYNLGHLFDIRGRDARQTFWYYMLFIVILYIAAWIVAVVPLIGTVMNEAMSAAQAGVPEDEMTARLTASMGPQLASIGWFSIIASLLFTLLTIAAVARRIHDSGNSGWWAGLVLAIKLGTLAFSVQALGKIDEAMEAISDPAKLEQMQATQADPLYMVVNLLGWAGPIIVIIFGVMSSDAPNRYGEEPVSF